MKIYRLLSLIAIMLITLGEEYSLLADNYDSHFCDSTLRIDYIFGGGPDGIQILQSAQSKSAVWAGRRNNLDSLPLLGNGEIQVIDPESKKIIYRNPFSTLFHEWLTTEEAQSTQRSFENTFQLPLPIHDADIKIILRNNRHDEIASLTTKYRIDDELVAIRGKRPLPYRYLHRGGDTKNAIDVAILAEGYTALEMDSFIYYAQKSVDEILNYEPFKSYSDKFNFVAVMSPSSESGVSVPADKDWKTTAFGAHFSTFHVSRYMTIPNVHKLYDMLEGIPFEHIMVMVNTDKYGGGGIFNSYHIAAARNNKMLPVSVHEFGHSFAGLADEYFYEGAESDTYPDGIEPWEPNITTLTNFSSKWEDMVNPDIEIPTPWKYESASRDEIVKRQNSGLYPIEINETIGVYEGAGYRLHGVYRPNITCRMRDNYHPSFCPVCRRAISHMIEFYL